jgi:transposase InsO family protein
VKYIRSDNGGEYFSKEFDAFYQMHGIARHKTTPYSPQKMEWLRG